MSGIELDKLMKFKSDIQLNFSKKVGHFVRSWTIYVQLGQLRQKVGERRPRVETVKCRIDADGLDTDRNGIYNDDDYIYGDDWSSDEGGCRPPSVRLRQCSARPYVFELRIGVAVYYHAPGFAVQIFHFS